MGMIYQRGKTYWIKYYRSGKPYRESTRSHKEADAKRLLKKREGEIANGKMPGIYFDRVIFDELADALLMDYRINQKKSLKRTEQSLVHLKTAFEGMRVPNITTDRIQAYIQGRLSWKCEECKESISAEQATAERCPHCRREADFKKPATCATINRELSALKRLLNLGAQQTPPKVDRVPHIPMLKETNVRTGFLDYNQFQALHDALPSYLQPLVMFAYHTGWRSEEVCTLTWSQVDLDGGIVRLNPGTTKNGQGRCVFMDDDLSAVIRQLWQARKRHAALTPFVFTNEQGTDRIRDFRGAWNTACRESGLGYGYRESVAYVKSWESKLPPGPILHDFRRSAIRNMVRAGTPERVAMMISGHKTRAVFDRYNIVSDEDLKAAATRQQAYLKTATGTVSGTIHFFDEKKESSVNA
jgi:integrase